jgi:hypothetical protein
MNTSAIIMMLTVQGAVTILTGFFFWRVLVTKPKTDSEIPDDMQDEE